MPTDPKLPSPAHLAREQAARMVGTHLGALERHGIAELIVQTIREDRERVREAMLAVPRDEIGELAYSLPDEDVCTTWEDHRHEHDEADEAEQACSTYTTICEGAERVRLRLLRVLRED